MTGFTTHLCWQVSLRLDDITLGQAQTAGVATGTILWRTLKDAADVTGFTARSQMHAGQRKTGL